MRIITCLDQNGGLFFNHRRQSQDKLLIADVISFCKGKVLYIAEYSKPLFPDCPTIFTVDKPLLTAKGGDFCFTEGALLHPVEETIEELILYRWDKVYPADTFLDLDLSRWHLQDTYELVGSSHDKITREVYTK